VVCVGYLGVVVYLGAHVLEIYGRVPQLCLGTSEKLKAPPIRFIEERSMWIKSRYGQVLAFIREVCIMAKVFMAVLEYCKRKTRKLARASSELG